MARPVAVGAAGDVVLGGTSFLEETLETMGNTILNNKKVGNVELFEGRKHISGDFVCPYCPSRLTDLGTFHVNAMNIAQRGNLSICTRCGCRDVAPQIQGRSEMSGTIRYWYPAAVSPIACLLRVCTCPNCGWWFAVQDADMCNDGFAVTAVGVLERFDLSEASVPIEVLRSELNQRASRIGNVHPRKMEELVASILAGVYDCEVHQLGFSRDGGVDLILLLRDRPIAVQVKRRGNLAKHEPVSLVREFLGAALLSGHSNLMFVTTAEAFSAVAKKEAHEAVKKGLVASYELISRDKLMSFLRLSEEPVWQKALVAAVDQGNTPTIPDPFTYTNSQPRRTQGRRPGEIRAG